MKNNKDSRLAEALFELNTIVNNNILPTIPSLTLNSTNYWWFGSSTIRVIDLTGTTTGHVKCVQPINKCHDDFIFELSFTTIKEWWCYSDSWLSWLSSIASVITDMITASGLNLDVIFTEGNQANAITMMESNDSPIDFTVLDLYSNRIDKLLYHH